MNMFINKNIHILGHELFFKNLPSLPYNFQYPRGYLQLNQAERGKKP